MNKDQKQRLLEAMGDIDEKYVREADPEQPTKQKQSGKIKRMLVRHPWTRYAAVAAVCIVVFGAIWLFAPLKGEQRDVSSYKKDEYYELIEKFAAYHYEEPQYTNRWEYFTDGLGNMFGGYKQEDGAAPEDNMEGAIGNGAYVEVTDNQVNGVTEADCIKRTDKYIYYLDYGVLKAYSIGGEETECLWEYPVAITDSLGVSDYTAAWEMFLSKDCTGMTIIAPFYNSSKEVQVAVISLDLTGEDGPKAVRRVVIDGEYKSARYVDGSLLVMTNYRVNTSLHMDYNERESFIPQVDYGYGKGAEFVPMDDIICPDELSDEAYTVVVKLDEKTLEEQGTKAFLSYSNDLYVSGHTVYAIRTYAKYENQRADQYLRCDMTELARVRYDGEMLVKEPSIFVEGNVKNRFAVDEYEGILRIVANTNRRSDKRFNPQTEKWESAKSGRNVSLYCIDLITGEMVAEVENFAPWGESAESVRFDGESAYVCTAVVVTLTDPVFYFDLSDLSHITYKDTGTIQGYSTSLIQLGEGYLLGIGRGDLWDSVKVEVYKETSTGVVSVCSYEVSDASYSENYKSYYIDRENRLFGFATCNYETQENVYTMLLFDGYSLVPVVREAMQSGYAGNIGLYRGLYIDDFVYIFAHNEFRVVRIFNRQAED